MTKETAVALGMAFRERGDFLRCMAPGALFFGGFFALNGKEFLVMFVMGEKGGGLFRGAQ